MSEDPINPEAQDEQLEAKSAVKSAKKAVKKSADKAEPTTGSESTGGSPSIKRNVRGSKKATAKKATKSPRKDAKKADADDGRSSGKQVRRGRGRKDQPKEDEPKVALDGKIVTKRAWKIFLGEVNEEGLALITDKDARELARRSLKIAEIYTREEVIEARKNKGKGSK